MIQAWSALLVLLVAFIPGMSMGQVLPADPMSEDKLIDAYLARARDPGDETQPGPGTTYYVSSSKGSDANNCRSRETPCKTRVEGIRPGDTVLFNRGDRWENHFSWLTGSPSGTKDAWITYGAYGSGNRPWFYQKSGKDVNVHRRSYIRLDRLDISHMQALRVRDKSHHIDITYTRIRDGRNACLLIAGGKDVNEAHNIQILNSWISGCGTGGKNGEGLYVSHSVDVNQRGGRDILVKDTVFTGIKGEPINIKYKTRGVVLDRILVWKNRASVNNDPGLLSSSNSDEDNAGHVLKNSLFIDNRGHDNRFNAALLLGKGWSIFNTVIAYNENMYCLRGVKGSRVYATTCYANSKGFYTTAEDGTGRTLGADDILCNIGADLWNNIKPDKSLFRDVDARDFRLRKATAEMKGGCRMNGTFVDLLGRDRPKRAWSFGAFEHMGDVPDDPDDPDDPVIPAPVNIGWCVCGCAEGTEGTLGDIHHVEECKGGCTACPEEGGVNIPMEKDTVIGPVLH